VGEPWALVADPGVDDAVAMAVLAGLGAVPDLVVAVPGNVGVDFTGRNAAGLAALLGWEIPVRAWDGPVRRREGSTHGDDGFGGLADHLPATDVPPPLDCLPADLLVTGPLSVVTGPVDRLVWMGGAVDRAGNVDGVAEFNAWCDPEAVERVLAEHAEVTRIVPLDVTTRVPLSADELDGPGGTAALLADAQRTADRRLVHDAVAAVAWVRPELFDWQPRSLRCAPTGALVVGRRPPTLVALDLDVEAVRATIRSAVAACP
jgi:inosine-uridine nucleoside N-ribohydrolase